jgi:hypothetical protein
MPITAKCPNAACGKTLRVKDELAGKKVKCPGCGTIIALPALDVPVEVEAPAAPAAPAVAEQPAAAGAVPTPIPALDQTKMIALYVGLGGLGLLVLSVFLPWFSFGPLSVLGISTGFWAILLLLFALAGGAGVGFGTFGKKDLLPLALVGGMGVGTYGVLWYLIFVFKLGGFSGFGLWLGLIASLAASGALTFVSLSVPYRIPPFEKNPLLRDFGGLIVAHAAGLVLGILFALLSGLATAPSVRL